MGWLALLFVVVPLVDLWLLLSIGDVLGFWPTAGMTLGVALLGGYLGKREGMKVLRQWRDAMAQLRMPEEGLVSAALVLAGAVLLATPGVLTDVAGLLLLVPLTRKPIAKLVRGIVAGRVTRAVERGEIRVNVVSRDDVGPAQRQAAEPEILDVEAEVVEAEVVDEASRARP